MTRTSWGTSIRNTRLQRWRICRAERVINRHLSSWHASLLAAYLHRWESFEIGRGPIAQLYGISQVLFDDLEIQFVQRPVTDRTLVPSVVGKLLVEDTEHMAPTLQDQLQIRLACERRQVDEAADLSGAAPMGLPPVLVPHSYRHRECCCGRSTRERPPTTEKRDPLLDRYLALHLIRVG